MNRNQTLWSLQRAANGRFVETYPLKFWEERRRQADRPLPEGAWAWFTTATFAYRVTEVVATRTIRSWAQAVARLADDHVLIAYSVAPQPKSGRLHVHALVSFPPDRLFDPGEAGRLWVKAGSVAGKFETSWYRPTERGAQYLADHGEAEIHVACPRGRSCRRDKGCIVAPYPWRPSEALVGDHRGRI